MRQAGGLPEWQVAEPRCWHEPAKRYNEHMPLTRKPYATMEGQGAPAVRQISVFVENRLGQLLNITQLFERQDIRMLSISIVDLVDCAVVRLLFDAADEAIRILRDAGYNVTVTEVVVVRLPKGKRGLLTVWSALLGAEISVAYAYPLLPTQKGSAIALYVDNVDLAIDTLRMHNFEVLDESDLQQDM